MRHIDNIPMQVKVYAAKVLMRNNIKFLSASRCHAQRLQIVIDLQSRDQFMM